MNDSELAQWLKLNVGRDGWLLTARRLQKKWNDELDKILHLIETMESDIDKKYPNHVDTKCKGNCYWNGAMETMLVIRQEIDELKSHFLADSGKPETHEKASGEASVNTEDESREALNQLNSASKTVAPSGDKVSPKGELCPCGSGHDREFCHPKKPFLVGICKNCGHHITKEQAYLVGEEGRFHIRCEVSPKGVKCKKCDGLGYIPVSSRATGFFMDGLTQKCIHCEGKGVEGEK